MSEADPASGAAAVAELLSRCGMASASVEPLAGDASTRRYFRARHASGRTVVIMDCGAPLPAQDDGSSQEPFPFLRWQRFYEEEGIRVPAVLDLDRPAGLVLLEDLGDEMLQHRVERLGARACSDLYARAVAIGRTLADAGPRAFPDGHAGDDDPLVPARLALEMDLFLAHAAVVDVPPGPPLEAARRALDDASGDLTDARALLHRLCEDVHAASSGALVPCHRDYHARNLMVVPGPSGVELAVIDFQDTRRGPRAYDLASLAWDPYVELPDDLVADLVARWRPEGADEIAWQREVDLAAGQRLLKAAGSYAYLTRAQRRHEYGRWLAPALSRARQRLASWPPREELWRALESCGIALPA